MQKIQFTNKQKKNLVLSMDIVEAISKGLNIVEISENINAIGIKTINKQQISKAIRRTMISKEFDLRGNSYTKKNYQLKDSNISLKFQKEINLNNSIKESIQLINKYQNNICLVIGSLYLVGEVLNLN